MVYPEGRFEPRATLEAVAAERCTSLYGVPTMFIAMLALPDFDALALRCPTLRTGIMAGSICPIDTMNQFMEKLNMTQLTICYGMTETSPVSFQSDVDDPVKQRCETVGRIHPHVECKVVDADGKVAPIGQPGELLTRGYNVMKGYWNNEQATRDSIDEDGWMHTGDLAVIDEEGFCTIVGRSKDVIIRGGENIFPRDIEDMLFAHPNVVNVAAVGIGHELLGEEVCAWVEWDCPLGSPEAKL